MQAIVQDTYGSADVLRLKDIEPPEIGDNDVLVRVHAAGLDPGVWHLMTGLPYLVRLMGYGLRAPKSGVLGFDVAGRVDAVGRNVTQLEVGDDVFGTCRGSFAEYACAEEENLALKPGNVSFEQAAAVPVSGFTALQGVRDQGKVTPVVDRTYPLAETADAIRYMARGHARGKVVINVSPSSAAE
jgi:NADPH:quinone reductase-like Zn-dependent oxidoreductase